MENHEKKRKGIVAVITAMAAALLLASPALATDRYVATDGNDAANDCSNSATPCATIVNAVTVSISGDTVHLAAGTYREANIDIDVDLTVQGNDQSDTIINADTDLNGQGNGRHLLVDNGNTVSISNITFQNGYPSADGGSISCASHSTLNIDSCTFSNNDNDSNYGGAIYSDCTTAISNSTFTGNRASDGGAIHVEGDDMTIDNCTFLENRAPNGYGGGISSDGNSLLITDTTISANEAQRGGGLNARGDTTIRRSTLSGNSSSWSGGGIRVENNSTVDLVNSTISGNDSLESGGGIAMIAGTANVHNTTITGNTADKNGPSGEHGGAIYVGDSVNNFFNVADSIISGNFVGNADNDCYRGSAGTINSGGYNLVGVTESGTCDAAFTSVGDVLNAVASAIINATLMDNGGPTETHALLSGSAAIDAGTPEGDGGCKDHAGVKLDKDQRSFAKPVAGRCDIGAYEQGTCGDGAVDSGEECDDGGNNSDTVADACRSDCTFAGCGDGVVDSGEECDGGDNCTDTCTLIAADDGSGTDEEAGDGTAAAASSGGGCSLTPVESQTGMSLLALCGSAFVLIGANRIRRRNRK